MSNQPQYSAKLRNSGKMMQSNNNTILNIEIRSIDGQQYLRLDNEEIAGEAIKAILQWYSSQNQSNQITVAINGQLAPEMLVSKTEFENALERAIEEGARRGEERVRRGISRNPVYRKGMGMR